MDVLKSEKSGRPPNLTTIWTFPALDKHSLLNDTALTKKQVNHLVKSHMESQANRHNRQMLNQFFLPIAPIGASKIVATTSLTGTMTKTEAASVKDTGRKILVDSEDLPLDS
jgi:hypothetical protein